ncbi:hypothetical protein ES332_D01G250700v1 [Gossypium tomentosum]|uniref:Uncharacterized protein n=1 Tax=Gossypium tomentosum TaxID=34277 RepID=A0A5D2MCW7_GOSTO|nr:hypothetical protein ES332_D01G250700v1 [Gossypium tomentosum]
MGIVFLSCRSPRSNFNLAVREVVQFLVGPEKGSSDF